MTPAELAADRLHVAKVESDSTDPFEYTAQALRNLIRDDEDLGPVFDGLDVEVKLDILYTIREILSQGLNSN